MIIFYAVELKELFKKGRNYPWQKPQGCPCCSSCRVWGHGFAEAIFDGYQCPLLLKLYRCPDCGCVIRLRPKGYFKRFQASVETIRSSIACKAAKNRWLTTPIQRPNNYPYRNIILHNPEINKKFIVFKMLC